jgi:hypothetical protein
MTESRVAAGRRRADDAKRLLAGVAVVGFAAALLLARAAHPGHAAHASPTPTASLSGQQSDDDFFASPSTLTPSTATPQVQTGVS